MNRMPYITVEEILLENQQASFDVGKYGVAFGYAKKGKPNTPLRISKTLDFRTVFGDPSLGFHSNFHYTALNSLGEAPLWCMRIANAILSGGCVICTAAGTNHSVSAGIPDISGYAFATNDLLLFAGNTYGDSDNDIGIKIPSVDDTLKTFVVEVYLKVSGVYTKKESFQVSRIKEKKDGFGESMYVVDKINKNSQYVICVDNTDELETVSPKVQSSTVLACAEGDSGTEPANSDIVTALENLSDLATLNVFTFPDCGYTHTTVQAKITSILDTALCGLGLFSAPFGSSTADAISHKASAAITSEYTAWYFPNTNVEDVINGRSGIPLGASAALQKQYLNHSTDNFTVPMFEQFLLPGVLEQILSAADCQLLLDAMINPITAVTGVGNYAQTELTSWPSEGFAQRISVRLLLNYVKTWLRVNFTGFRGKRFTLDVMQKAQSKLQTLLTYLLGQEAILAPPEGTAKAVCDQSINNLNTDTLNAVLYMTPTSIIKNLAVKVIVTPAGVDISVSVV